MVKVAFIGAGSLVFTRNLCSDILLVPALQDCTIALMDIDPARLEQARQVVQAIVDRRGLKTHLETTTDRRTAIRAANYVVTTFQQGGLEAYRTDIEIPRRYGVEQCVGDTLGPGGVFRALRTIPVLLDICRDMDALAPDGLLINYVNPMAANCWAVARASGRPHVGLCHSIQGTSEMLARWVGVPHAEVVYCCAGINHQAFFLEFRRGKEDLYPHIWRAISKPDIYAAEPVRIEMMKHFGYFITESSGHASEYTPYFRKSARMVEEDLVPRFKNPKDGWFGWGRTGGYLTYTVERLAQYQNDYQMLMASGEVVPAERSNESCSIIIEAIETARPAVITGNVPNGGLITNLPQGCCVEVPCLVDGMGIQPTAIGAMPPQLAALNRACISVQELTVEAAVGLRRDAIYHAAMLDPLTAAVCTLDQARALVDEMLAAQARWLPEYR